MLILFVANNFALLFGNFVSVVYLGDQIVMGCSLLSFIQLLVLVFGLREGTIVSQTGLDLCIYSSNVSVLFVGDICQLLADRNVW